jgi:Protein of unknown function (DUF3048) N-terminal domain
VLNAAALVVLLMLGAVAYQAARADLSTPVSAGPATDASAWPLTGVPADTVADRPALAVKIENSAAARPQTGLNAADLVWEQVVEGGITRFVTVYHSNLPPEIGPVRSVRPMDPAIAAPLHGLLAFSGGVQTYITAAKNAGLQVLSESSGSDGFHRTQNRRAPHNVYAALQTLVAQADAAHQASPGTQFDYPATGQQPTAVAAGRPAASLALTMSGVSHPRWTWSAAEGRWLRAEGSTPAVEAGGQRIGATNVVVLRVDVVATEARDPAGNPVPETSSPGGARPSSPPAATRWRPPGPSPGSATG